MEIRTVATVIIDLTEDVKEMTIKDVEKVVGFRINSREHREHIEEGLHEILSEELASKVNSVTVIDLKTE